LPITSMSELSRDSFSQGYMHPDPQVPKKVE